MGVSRVAVAGSIAVIVGLSGCRKKQGDEVVTADTTAAAAVANYVARACSNVDASRMPDPSGSPPRDGYTPLAMRDSLLRAIDAAEAKWRSARPPSYTMTAVGLCFCRDRGQPIVLRVNGDSVFAARDTTGQPAWPGDWRESLHVAGLFKEARLFVCDSTRTTRFTLDPKLGYPRVVTTQSRLEMSDTDREYRVLGFEANR